MSPRRHICAKSTLNLPRVANRAALLIKVNTAQWWGWFVYAKAAA